MSDLKMIPLILVSCQIMACLQESGSVGKKRVKAKVFIQDPFNSVLLTEDAGRYVDMSNIACALICHKFREDTVEFEDDLILSP